MPVETGTLVKPGDLIVQVDTRDVQNKYDQANAALAAAQAKLSVAESDKKRNEEMFKARVITPQEFEQVAVNYENAKSGVVSAKANLDLAQARRSRTRPSKRRARARSSPRTSPSAPSSPRPPAR